MIRRGFLVGGVIALALITSQLSAQELKPSSVSFGALPTPEAKAVRAQAEAWLKQSGQMDNDVQDKLSAIWKENNRPVLDRVTATLTLGSAEAAKLLEEASNPLKPAPTTVPKLITNTETPAFFRANLALAYSRELVHRRVYEEALQALKAVRAEDVADPAAYLFFRAVCEHGTLLKEEATRSIDRLIDDVVDSPERYRTVGLLMALDMETWKDKDLGEVARKMDNVERRLDLARGGPQTQKIQKDIVRRLDEIIKKLENQAKNNSPNGGA